MLDLKNQRLLVIAPHADDEVIGCAGLIQKIKKEGGKVFVLFLTLGDTKDFSKNGFSSFKDRKREIEKVAEFLNYDDYDIAFIGNKYHLKLDLLGQKKIIEEIETKSKISLERIKPSILAIPSFSSYNQDHKIAAISAHAAARPANPKDKYFVQTVIGYEEPVDFWSSIAQSPSLFVRLTKEEIDNKKKALKLYETQVRDFPNLRSLKSLELLANLRGAQAGTEYAEGFFVNRII